MVGVHACVCCCDCVCDSTCAMCACMWSPMLYDIDTCREHDKGPDVFSSALMKLVDAGLEFCVSILGAHTSDIPGTCIKIY